MPQRDEYFLQVGERGRERLHLLNQLYNPSTQHFLLQSGLSKGMRVLEIGCGPGEMSLWLAEQVGSAGSVVASDQSDEQLTLARAAAHSANLRNIEFHAVSTYDVGTLDGQFDLIYGRWALLHSRRPLDAVKALRSKLKPGGTLALEDCVTASAFCYPEERSFELFRMGWPQVSKQKGIDAEIGDKLHALLFDVGCTLKHYSVFQPPLRTPQEKALIAMCVEESRQVHVDTGVLSENAIDALTAELTTLAQRDHHMGFVKNVQVAGVWRP